MKKKYKLSAETRRRMSEAQKRRHNGGHAPPATPDPAKPKSVKALARDEVTALAKHGARARLKELEQEIVKLRVFLGES